MSKINDLLEGYALLKDAVDCLHSNLGTSYLTVDGIKHPEGDINMVLRRLQGAIRLIEQGGGLPVSSLAVSETVKEAVTSTDVKKIQPSQELFVVRQCSSIRNLTFEVLPPTIKVLKLLSPFAGAVDERLVEIQGQTSGRLAWETLMEKFEQAQIFPMYFDPSGIGLYFIGVLTIRFDFARLNSVLPYIDLDDVLEHFGRTFDMEFLWKDQLIEHQAQFRPRGAFYLPELIDKIEQSPAVTHVWPETRAAYQRSSNVVEIKVDPFAPYDDNFFDTY